MLAKLKSVVSDPGRCKLKQEALRPTRVPAIIQARMGSTRLPGKVLLDLSGSPVLGHIVQRAESARLVSEVWVATSDREEDDVIETWCLTNRVRCFRGSSDDVLNRFATLAEQIGAPWALRITGDCPVVDPEILDEVIRDTQMGSFDGYGLHGEFPNGLDCTAYSLASLLCANEMAQLPSEREHVGPYILNRPDKFRIGQLVKFTGMAHHRWTLDEPQDYDFLTLVFRHLYPDNPIFGAREILNLLEQRPWIPRLNSDVVRGAGMLPSLLRDREVTAKTPSEPRDFSPR